MKSITKAGRLLRLLQTLHRYRYPVIGKELADELGVSLRTLYRDIAALTSQGAHIDGSPGVGYRLRPGFLLPPLSLTQEEIEALVLGSRWVNRNADPELQQAAANLLSKVEAVLPAELRQEMASSGLIVGPPQDSPMRDRDLALLRKAIRVQTKLRIRYEDLGGEETRRTVWPFALAYFDRALLLIAWCELRRDYRHFRTDRIREFSALADRYPRNRRTLLEEWRKQNSIPAPGARQRSSPRAADRI